MHKRPVAWANAGGTQDPRGHGRPPAALLPGPARDRRPGRRHGLLGAAGRAGGRERGQGPQGPLLPGLLRHPGRRATTSSTCSHEISRELGLTHDWPVAIVGVGQPRPRARQLPRLRRPGLPGRGAGRRRPGQGRRARSATWTIESLDDLPAIVAERGHRHRHHRDAGGGGAGGRRPPRRRRRRARSSTSRRRWSTVPDGVSLRKVDLAIELQILSFYQQRTRRRPATGRTPRAATRRRRRSTGMSRAPVARAATR